MAEPLEPTRREVVRTPEGDLVSVPRVRRRSWVATIAAFMVILLAVIALLLTHQPGATSPGPGPAQPTPVSSFP
jgi:hypothetical protein